MVSLFAQGTPKDIQMSIFLWASNRNSFSLKIWTHLKLSTIMGGLSQAFASGTIGAQVLEESSIS